jgi:hypothetical protein
MLFYLFYIILYYFNSSYFISSYLIALRTHMRTQKFLETEITIETLFINRFFLMSNFGTF